MAEADPAKTKRRVRRNGPTSRDIQRENTRNRIIQCALKVFGDKGFEGGSTRDIAAAAGVRQALISHYFDSKYALWQAAIESLFDDIGRRYSKLQVYDTDRPIEDRLRSLVRGYISYIHDHPEHARLMQHAAMHGGEQLEWIDATHMRPRYNASFAMLREGIAKGVLPDVNPVLLHFTLSGAIHSFYLLEAQVRSLSGIDPRAPEILEEHAQVIFELFLRDPSRKM